MAGQPGSGAGKGGGSGGSIRDAGGSFGKMEAAHEDQYFYNLVGIFSLLLIFFALLQYDLLITEVQTFYFSKRHKYKRCERASTMKSHSTRNRLSVMRKL